MSSTICNRYISIFYSYICLLILSISGFLGLFSYCVFHTAQYIMTKFANISFDVSKLESNSGRESTKFSRKIVTLHH